MYTDRGVQTLGESHISALTGILTGFALTSDNLALLPPERLALLGRAATLRMRNVRPGVKSLGWGEAWPSSFIGTVGGAPAAALVNEGTEPKTWKLAEIEGFAAERPCEELLHPLGAIAGDSITVGPHDAVLLVQH